MSIVYIVLPLLLVGVVLASVWLDRWSVPVILVALGMGILFGSDVLNLWYFGDMKLTNEVANIALVFILFNGGFGTRLMGWDRVTALAHAADERLVRDALLKPFDRIGAGGNENA